MAVSRKMLIDLTDVNSVDDIEVVAIRSKKLFSVFEYLLSCIQLKVAFLQGNLLSSQDISMIPCFNNLIKVDLS